MAWRYEELKGLLAEETLPAVIVDMDLLDQNIARMVEIASSHGKTLRLATKSVRVPKLIHYILEKGGRFFRGLMCYSAQEALALMKEGLDDFLVAYPSVAEIDFVALRTCMEAGRRVCLMIDEPEHLALIEKFWKGQTPLPVCIDVDMSYRPFFGLHLGVKRSPIRTLPQFGALVDAVKHNPKVRLSGVMGYEAQIAGLTDKSPFTWALNPLICLMKWLSRKDVAKRREEIAMWLQARDLPLDFFNGGGTGSLSSTSRERHITEVTAGSGFLQSHLFDYYVENRNAPAFVYALAVTRIPEPGFVTCQSGGFLGSGAVGRDKAPIVFLPEGIKPTATEGFGEVQTPFTEAHNVHLKLGDPVFLRPAKAGEIAERFTHYLLKRGNRIVDRVPTYRGIGGCFF